jgi:hypothetical protein
VAPAEESSIGILVTGRGAQAVGYNPQRRILRCSSGEFIRSWTLLINRIILRALGVLRVRSPRDTRTGRT